jgi:hypothetical protein
MNERESEGKAAESLENETLPTPLACHSEEPQATRNLATLLFPERDSSPSLRVGITGFTKVFQHPVREAVAVLRR